MTAGVYSEASKVRRKTYARNTFWCDSLSLFSHIYQRLLKISLPRYHGVCPWRKAYVALCGGPQY